jgi:hypothetical protein
MAVYYVNINRTVSNVKVCIIKKPLKDESNKFSRFVDSLIKKYLLKEKPIDSN